jgi:DNA-binding NarL/FixJ family response regulator
LTPRIVPVMEKIRVFILDDHEIVRNGLRQTLERHDDIEVVGEAGLVAEALRRIPALMPTVAIVDGRLPDGTGIDVCRELKAEHPGIAFLILTSFDDDEALFSAIMAGAAGYVLKEIRGNDLVSAIRTVAAGGSLLSPSVTQRVLARLREGPKEDPVLVELSTREREILGLVSEGLTNRQIGSRIHLSEKTVKNYVSSILEKLSLTSRTQAAVLAVKHLGQEPSTH